MPEIQIRRQAYPFPSQQNPGQSKLFRFGRITEKPEKIFPVFRIPQKQFQFGTPDRKSKFILIKRVEKIPEEIKNEYVPKLKLIPFASLGKQNGMLVGIKPEKIEVINEQTEEEKNAIIGIYNKSLTKRGEYKALIGIDLY